IWHSPAGEATTPTPTSYGQASFSVHARVHKNVRGNPICKVSSHDASSAGLSTSLKPAVATAMKEGESRLRRIAPNLDRNPMVLSIVESIGRLVADHILIVNLAGKGNGYISNASPVVDGEGPTSGEFGNFVQQLGPVDFTRPHGVGEGGLESQSGRVDLGVG